MGESNPSCAATTRWSLVRAAGGRTGPEAEAALASLCQIYWPAVYAFVRRQVADLHEAQDLTQEFFARWLEQNLAAKANRSRGRFRSFLLASVRNFLHNERDKARTRKRGGGKPLVSLDFSRTTCEPAEAGTPEKHFERQWALALLDQVLAAIRAEYVAVGKVKQFEVLKETLTGPSESWEVLGKKLGLTANAAKVAGHRLRKRYRDRLRQEVAQTLEDPEEVDDEIRLLFAALQS